MPYVKDQQEAVAEVPPEVMLLSVDAVAVALSIAPGTVRTLIAEGALPSVRIKGRRLVRRADLCAYVDGLEVA